MSLGAMLGVNKNQRNDCGDGWAMRDERMAFEMCDLTGDFLFFSGLERGQVSLNRKRGFRYID